MTFLLTLQVWYVFPFSAQRNCDSETQDLSISALDLRLFRQAMGKQVCRPLLLMISRY